MSQWSAVVAVWSLLALIFQSDLVCIHNKDDVFLHLDNNVNTD